MSTKQEQETKEWTNIDYTNTGEYRTVKNFKKEGVTWMVGEGSPGYRGGIPENDMNNLRKLRKLDGIIRQDKGPITKEIHTMHRRVVRQMDKDNKPISKEYLVVKGYFQGFDWSGVQYGEEFTEGASKRPIMGKVYASNMRLNPETGEDLGRIDVIKVVDDYYIEVPNDATKRKKLIDSFIENASGTYPENIKYYYHDADGWRDATYSAEQFITSTIDELRDLSKRGAGAKGGSGYWRDKDNILR